MDKPDNVVHVEQIPSRQDVESQNGGLVKSHTTGTTRLYKDDDVILVPTPTMDTRDPLNYAPWKKWAILLLVSAYSSTAVLLSSGMGAIITVVKLDYPGDELRTNDLMTYPTLFMGLGNLVAMPLALAMGRRPVFLASLIVLTLAGMWCALSASLTSHIAGRNIMSLAAGQSEALAPMMIQEMHFLHERSRKLTWFIFIQNIAVGIFFIATQFLCAAYGWRWWYGLFTIINGVAVALSFFLVAETAFDRPDSEMVGEASTFEQHSASKIGAENPKSITEVDHKQRLAEMVGRKWTDGLGFIKQNPDFKMILPFYWRTLQGLLIWPVAWVFLINGAWLGLYVVCASTFAPVLIMPPYHFSFVNLAFVQGAQIIVCLVFLPMLGYGGDWLIKMLVKRNNNLFKPEFRLWLLVVPSIVGIVCSVIYGQAASAKDLSVWNWGSVAVAMNGGFFAFLGANIVGITYTVDAFPTRAGPLLVLICAGRGIVSFGLSYATLPAVAAIGYDGMGNVYAIITGVLSLFAIPVYIWGPRARVWADRKFKITNTEDSVQ
ncbi:major facilitator superfamily domain-containing protein [Microdochium bolleyi]|uniref:Major facilitator superfamily domain-containing protein n=1 Tax=Microdochium bolleyi TaxID=196109 RepID=A0A136J904_9PEZI|nr:major facilitator superfamily domain-containing protein [Microdochium bolleyi]